MKAATLAALLMVAASAKAAAPAQALLVFAGDTMLDGEPGRAIAEGRDPLAGFRDIFAPADAVIANLECSIATGGSRVDKPFAFRAHPRVATPLARAHLAVSLANNHSGDYGKAGLVETMDILRKAGVAFFGAGRTLAEAHAPLIIERQGLRIAILGYDEFMPRWFEATASTPGVAWSEEEQVLADIRTARSHYHADLVVPYFHWGWEREAEPNAHQRDLAHRCIDAGADAVMGGHPHVTQGAEEYKGRPIVYSLGNFVFDGFESEATTTGWVARLWLDRSGVVRWDTVVARLDARGLPKPRLSTPSPCGTAGATTVSLCAASRPHPENIDAPR